MSVVVNNNQETVVETVVAPEASLTEIIRESAILAGLTSGNTFSRFMGCNNGASWHKYMSGKIEVAPATFVNNTLARVGMKKVEFVIEEGTAVPAEMQAFLDQQKDILTSKVINVVVSELNAIEAAKATKIATKVKAELTTPTSTAPKKELSTLCKDSLIIFGAKYIMAAIPLKCANIGKNIVQIRAK